MKIRFRLYRRKKGGRFYIEDCKTGKQKSLETRDRATAMAVVHARNEAVRQPHLNLQLARTYLSGTDSGMTTRTWQDAFVAITETKHGSTQVRWRGAARQKAFDLIRQRVTLETQPEHLLACLKAGTVSTNIQLRKLHNFCLAMGWLMHPILPMRLWPVIRHQPRRAITHEEHRRIIGREQNPERRDLYELCWHLGGSQGDIANLTADDIDWPHRTMAYVRQKTGSVALINFGSDIEAVLRRLPSRVRCFRICEPFALATAPLNSDGDARGCGLQVSPFIRIATLGQNALSSAATPSDSHKRLSAIIARRYIEPTRVGQLSNCRRWKATNGEPHSLPSDRIVVLLSELRRNPTRLRFHNEPFDATLCKRKRCRLHWLNGIWRLAVTPGI